MAQVLEKDPATYFRERDGFIRDLQHFHDTKGTPFKKQPTIDGKDVDLYLLYSLVTEKGGWIKVNSKNEWSELLPHFNLPAKCINGSIALKQIYLRYLDRYEKLHYMGEEGDRGSDDDEDGRHKRCSARTLHMVPLTYNYNQHNVTDANREFNNLSTDLYKPTDYDRLALSLISPLPNEQDFAINVCTLLSNDGKHTLKIEKNPRLLDYLLAHAGLFNHESTKKLFIYNYNVVRKHPIHNFWDDALDSEEILNLVRSAVREEETKTPKKVETNNNSSTITNNENTTEGTVVVPMEIDTATSTTDKNDAPNPTAEAEPPPQPVERRKFALDPSDTDLFCLRRNLGTQDYFGQRVLQIATILRNLSFIEDNVPVLARNRTFLGFAVLCSQAKWNYLKNLGLDMLGNVAGEFVVRDCTQDKLASALLTVVTRGLESSDRLWCLSSLEVLNKLSQNELNEEVLMRTLDTWVYQKVCSFLTIHDVMLLIYTLECLYALSSLGERSCNLIVNNHGVVDTLVSLVTVEGKSYGPKACIGMKLVETVSGAAPNTNSTPATSAAATGSGTATTSTSTTIQTQATRTSQTSTATTGVNANKVVSSPCVIKPNAASSTSKNSCAMSTPVRTIQMAPQRLLAVSPSPPMPTAVPVSSNSSNSTTTSTSNQNQSLTPQQLIQQQHAHQQAIQENEQFALAWLRATYEPCGNSKVNSQELYKHYINSCTKIGRRGVISPLHFPRCVRSVFGGTVGPNPMKTNNPKEAQFYDGIKVRDQPLNISVPPSSPVPSPQPAAATTTTNNAKTASAGRRKSKQKDVAAAKPPTSPVNAPQSLAVVNTQSLTPSSTSIPQLSPAEMAVEAGAPSPASPILKAQLSAPPKQRETMAAPTTPTIVKTDVKSQALAHPHLSQALLGNMSNTTNSVTNKESGQQQQPASQQASNTSLIKSLLANKVNECMTLVSMRTAECQKVVQVAERQQRLLAQQGQINMMKTPSKTDQQPNASQPNIKLNGSRQLFGDDEVADPSVSSTTPFENASKTKKEPPQPPPPPLAPLTATAQLRMVRPTKVENDDSDSYDNHSLASSIVGVGGISSTEDGENSLTSFEGLLNGVPNIDNPLNEDSNSKDSTLEITRNKPLRLADLLEKKVEKTGPIMLNGSLCKDMKLNARGVDIVENHIEKALIRNEKNEQPAVIKEEAFVEDVEYETRLKRPATDDISKIEAKKPCVSVNGNATNPATEAKSVEQDVKVEVKQEEESNATVSNAAAKLFADMAADILEDEDEEQLMQEAAQPQPTLADASIAATATNAPAVGQLVVDNGTGQMLIATQPRQIIMSQPNAALKQTTAVANTSAPVTQQTVIVQNSGQQRTTAPVMLQQTNAGQILLSQGLQGQVQFVTNQSGQYVLQAGNTPGTYMVAQPQTAMVHGQPQTVLVAQTAQQHATGAKTIIILQQQPAGGTAGHQKVMMTPQGQQVVVTQMPRPMIHTSIGNIVQTPTVIKSNPVSTTSATTTTPATASVTASPNVTVVKQEDVKPKPRIKVVKDLTHPFICDWGDCPVTTKFKSANAVYLHACEAHCPQTNNEEVVCQWERCDNLKRKKFSLMTHLHDKHCNTEAMKQALVKRKSQPTSTVKTEPAVSSGSTSPHPGYAPDAALHAIKRHALEFVNPKELQDDNEGPVTKSIRLTASLILRNLVIYSGNCRRYLKHYESHLANVALSNVESSRTIAQILFDMNENSNHR